MTHKLIEDSFKPFILNYVDGCPVVFVPKYANQYPNGIHVRSLLASGDGNTKMRKNVGYVSCGLSLKPSIGALLGNTCGFDTSGCREACLDHQGLASVWVSIDAYRIAKTACWFQSRRWFLSQLRSDLERWERKASRKGMALACRLNMFSDIPWERYGIPQDFPDVQFYDYTKWPKRIGRLARNYWLTFSRSENNDAYVRRTLDARCNATIVFFEEGAFAGNASKRQRLPRLWNGYRVIDGDVSDLRFEDSRARRLSGFVVGLRLKAHSVAERTKAILSGFAVETT